MAESSQKSRRGLVVVLTDTSDFSKIAKPVWKHTDFLVNILEDRVLKNRLDGKTGIDLNWPDKVQMLFKFNQEEYHGVADLDVREVQVPELLDKQ